MNKRSVYEKELEARIEEWNAEIAKLRARATKLEAEAQKKYLEEIEDLKARQDAVRQKLHELRASSEGAWDDLKAGVQQSYEDMERAIKTAMQRF